MESVEERRSDRNDTGRLSQLFHPERMRSVVAFAQGSGLLAAVIALFGVFTVVDSRFLSHANLLAILVSVAIVGIVAIPGAMLIVSGYVDFTVGSVAVLAAIAFGELVVIAGMSVALAALLALAIGASWGLLAGFLICRLELSAIVVTLGGFAGLRGIAEYISEGQTQFGFGEGFRALGNSTFLGLPAPVWMLVVLFLLGFYLWYLSPFGRHITATGSDPVAAHALGIKTKRLPLQLYIASGTLSALGGLILASQLDASSLSIGVGLEIQVLTAILLGGVAFSGGRGSLFGVLLGVLFIGILTNGLVVANVSPYITNVAVGAALVLAAGMDVLYQRMDRLAVRHRDNPAGVVTTAPTGKDSQAESPPPEGTR